jgi:D-mannonate dehydratase
MYSHRQSSKGPFTFCKAVGIVRLRTKATEFVCLLSVIPLAESVQIQTAVHRPQDHASRTYWRIEFIPR